MNILDKTLGTKRILLIVPAYNRKYGSYEEAISDWEEGYDFKVTGGPYLSIRDMDEIKKNWDGISIQLVNINLTRKIEEW